MCGSLQIARENTVRVRVCGKRGYLTVKGPSDPTGTERYEWEKEIPVTEAKELLRLCKSGIIEKTRYKIKYGRHIFVVDVFHGENEGLIMAEIELSSPGESFERPSWLGKEVTGDQRYYNSYLSRNPYSGWRC